MSASSPLRLYRSILRVHRRLGPAERMLGDLYVKSEFRLHKDVTDGVVVVKFLEEWKEYLKALQGMPQHNIPQGGKLIEKLNDEQVGQLYELMRSIKEGAEAKHEEMERQGLYKKD